MSKVNKSKAVRDWHTGQSSQQNVAPAIPFAAVTGMRGVQRFHNLESQDQQRGFLDGMIANINDTRHWGEFYEHVSLMREQDWYWKAQGYDSFEDFWHDKVGGAFSQLEELETTYNFAKLASPTLFNVDFEVAKNRISEAQLQIARLSTVKAMGDRGRPKGAFSSKQEATDRVGEAMAYKRLGGNSLERRMAKMKNKRPDVAARVLAGEFLRESDDGRTVMLDMNRAEKEAYGESNAERQKAKTKPVKASIPLLDKMLNTRSKAMQKKIFDKVVDCKWLMEMINGG